MLKLVLLFDNDNQVKQRLARVLGEWGVKEVTQAVFTRDVLMAVADKRYDLIILPVEHGLHLIDPLRALQADCPIILTTSNPDEPLPAGSRNLFQGVLLISRLETDLPELLNEIRPVDSSPAPRPAPPPTPDVEQRPSGQERPVESAGQPISRFQGKPPDPETFQAICQQSDLHQAVQLVVFSRSSKLLICGGRAESGEKSLGQAVAARIDDTWDKKDKQAQIEYWKLPGWPEEMMLYSRPAGTAVMTLVASPGTPVSELRLSSDRLLARLSQPAASQTPQKSDPDPPAGEVVDHPRGASTGFKDRWPSILGALLFVLKHLAFGILVLLALIFVTYFGLNAARGMSVGEAATDAVSDTVTYVGRLVQGDLGATQNGTIALLPVPVSDVLAERLPRSLALMGIALLTASIAGLALGISAARRGSSRSLGIILVTIIGVSVPSFFAAVILQTAVITLTKQTGRPWLPVGGWGWDSHLVLPVLVLAARPLAQITRVTFVTVREVLDQDYVRTAYSKGLRRVQIMGRHVLRNAAGPILVTIGVSLSFILGSLPIVEMYFGIRGIGFTLLAAIARQDDDLAIALLLCMGILFLVVRFFLDIGKQLADPRSSLAPEFLATKGRRNPIDSIKSFAGDLGDYLTDNGLTRLAKNAMARRNEAKVDLPALAHTPAQLERIETAAQPTGRRVGWAAAYRNTPLVIGGILMVALLIVVLFGAFLAPHSPYQTQGLQIENGEFSVPPFEPSAEYPWGTDVLGRDMASLILAGAQSTLLLVVLVVITRMVVGILLGAITGWQKGSWFDRLVQGTAEIIAAYPNVLLAMLIILALGIRQGMRPFIIGMAVVGWGDTMQFVRSEVAALRPRAFIESAVAIGARTPRIIYKHIMPNLFSPLIAIFSLEMGSVLMLLGELGFLSIFIGGGAFVELEIFGAPIHYSDVPEWGALLSNIRAYSRAYPWLAIYPTLAFFIAILAFNLFGEGMRRLVDDGSIIVNRLLNRYTLAGAALLVVIFIWFRSNSGPTAFYSQHAEEYDGQRAAEIVADLTAPEMDGRGLGTTGLDEAAAYIAEQFEAYGLQPAGEQFTYFQERFRSFERLESIPELLIDDGGAIPEYGQDFAVYPGYYQSIGEMKGQVRQISLGDPINARGFGADQRYRELRTADFSDEILLALSYEDGRELLRVANGGLLVVVEDPELLQRRFTLSGRSQVHFNLLTGVERGGDSPSLWITEDLANRLLDGTGKTVAQLREEAGQLELGEIQELPLGVEVDMAVDGTLEERWPVANVIGHMPGYASLAGESQMDQQLILVLAQYDSPPPGPEAADYPAANDNASGVAVMLEAIRVLQETEFIPNRTLLFVAYSGEGLEGGENVSEPEISRFLQAKLGFARAMIPEAIIYVHGVGGGSGDNLEVSAGGSLRLAELFESAGRRMGAGVKRGRQSIDISIIYDEGSPTDSAQEVPEVRLSWEGWGEHARLPSDTMENISADNLEEAGRTLALALMIMGRERQY